jgi:hypothetical protein
VQREARREVSALRRRSYTQRRFSFPRFVALLRQRAGDRHTQLVFDFENAGVIRDKVFDPVFQLTMSRGTP